MKFVNSWLSNAKQEDKFEVTLRFGKFTLIELSFDISQKKAKIIIANFGFEN